jgi:putative hydrolase of the HAD superfamily
MSSEINTGIKAIVFDMGGVLVTHKDAPLAEKMAVHFQVPYDLVKKALGTHVDAMDKGLITTAEFHDAVATIINKETGKTLTGQELWLFRKTSEQWIPDMQTLISKLKKNYPLILFSNFGDSFPLLDKRLKITVHFNPSIVSYAVKMIKPEPAFYQYLIEKSGLKASELLFVDNLSVNIAGAKKQGIPGIVFVGYENLLLEMKKFNIKVD